MPAMLLKVRSKLRAEHAFFSSRLNPITENNQADPNHASPSVNRKSRADRSQIKSRIDGMSQARVWSGADQFVIFFDRDTGAPVLSQMPARPQCQRDPGPGERDACHAKSKTARQNSAAEDAAMNPQRLILPVLLLTLAGAASAADLPKAKVDLQPLAAQARRVADALELLGAPLSADERKALADAKDADAVQGVLDKHCLFGLRLHAPKPGESPTPITAEPGPAKPDLAEQGWRVFLVRCWNRQVRIALARRSILG